ncbi:MAG: flippase-like domain-containing protein [Alphaproteobacteria bacterium]|nr:flippase-like domain-containing protein [Alphaproteobacteria bacterium]
MLWGIDPGEALGSLEGVRWWLAAPMTAFYLAAHTLRTVRLRALLDRPVPFGPLFSINSIGYLAINVVPLRLGEFVRPYLLMERQGVPFGASMAAIFVERLVDILCLLALLAGVTWLVELPPQGVVVGDVDVVTAGQRLLGVVVVGGAAFIAALMAFGAPVIRLVERLVPVEAVSSRLGAFLWAFHDGLRQLVRQPVRATVVLVWSVLIWGLTIGAVWCVLLAFDGVPHSLQAAATTWTITITGMTVAPTPGFFGSYEAFCLASLMLWEVGRDLGGTFSVIMHLGQFGFTVVLGGAFLVMEGLSLREVVEASRQRALRTPLEPRA